MKRILITGAGGQIGRELSIALQKTSRKQDHLVLSDKVVPDWVSSSGLVFEQLNVLDKDHLKGIVKRYKVGTIFHMAAILSAMGESNPSLAWDVNMQGLLNVLEVSRTEGVGNLFWPSSIAVFGPSSPRKNTPQFCYTDPGTIYGISKLAGERLMEYYHIKYGLDTRSLRYPGIISSRKLPVGGGTTDYAIEMYRHALSNKPYECYLERRTTLPMMYMSDAVRATLSLMEAAKEQINVRTSYNITAMSFSPSEQEAAIREHVSGLRVAYKPDFRQAIAMTWPESIDDSPARQDWGWQPEYDLAKMTEAMLESIRNSLQSESNGASNPKSALASAPTTP